MGAERLTGSLHLWVLTASGEEPPGCGELIARTASPYDVAFERHADQVFLLPDQPQPTAEGVPSGEVLVYVEAIDFLGAIHLAGCVAEQVGGGEVAVPMPMTAPGTFDCAAADTEDGAPCDDGLVCTVGERCNAGACGGGAPRDCTFVADACHGESCDEELGCVAVALPNGTPCSDGLFCSSGDICQEGACVGADRDCSSVENQCNASMCNEALSQCVADPLPNTTPCDDGLFCTDPDSCTSGFCDGADRDCSDVEDQCNASTCNETANSCDPVPLTGPTCDDSDACTEGDTCASGECVGTLIDGDGDGFPPVGCGGGGPEDCDDTLPDVNPDATEGPLGNATCSDSLDNDCDGNTDAVDEDCQ